VIRATPGYCRRLQQRVGILPINKLHSELLHLWHDLPYWYARSLRPRFQPQPDPSQMSSIWRAIDTSSGSSPCERYKIALQKDLALLYSTPKIEVTLLDSYAHRSMENFDSHKELQLRDHDIDTGPLTYLPVMGQRVTYPNRSPQQERSSLQDLWCLLTYLNEVCLWRQRLLHEL
jgi:hypothetical protein